MYADHSTGPSPNSKINETPEGDLPCGAALEGRVHKEKDVHPGAGHTYGTQTRWGGRASHRAPIDANLGVKGWENWVFAMFACQLFSLCFIWTHQLLLWLVAYPPSFRQDTAQESYCGLGLVPTVDQDLGSMRENSSPVDEAV